MSAAAFLNNTYVFGTSTSVMYRSDLVRSQGPFYNEANLHADMESCLVSLKNCDFGFVHQVLTFKRWRPESLGTFTAEIQTIVAGRLHSLVTHGKDFLSEQEYEKCLDDLLAEYYNLLAVNLARLRRDNQFWKYHKLKLTDAGCFSWKRLASAVVSRACRAVLNPYETFQKMREGFGNARQNTPTSAPAVTSVTGNGSNGIEPRRA